MSRWKNSKQHPLQFYKPVEDDEWADALVFDIYVYEAGWVVFLRGCTGAANFYMGNNVSAFSYVNLSPIYDLRDEEGKTVSSKTHPDLFTDLPWHNNIDSHTFGAIQYFSKILTINKPPFFKVDWGDGEFLETKGEIVKNIIVNEKNFTAKGFSSVSTENKNFTFGHNYKEPGRYTIKIKTNMANFYFLPTYNNNYYYANGVSNKGGRCNLLKIRQWGSQLKNLRSLAYFFKVFIYGKENAFLNANLFEGMPEIDWSQFTKVIDLTHAFNFYDSYENDILIDTYAYWKKNEFDWPNFLGGGEKFFSNFPNLMGMYDCFYMHQWFTYIPRYLFKDNPFIMDLSYAFSSRDIIYKYIGEGACKNLHYLSKIDNVFAADLETHPIAVEASYFSFATYEIEDSIFENCDHLRVFRDYCRNPVLKKIGNRVFANCYNLNIDNVTWNNSYMLSSIGDEVFANCYNIRDVSYLFSDCINLQTIGKDIFKNCSKISDISNIFEHTFRLRKIPDNLFSAVETGLHLSGDFAGCYDTKAMEDWSPDLIWRENEIKTPENFFIKFIGRYGDGGPGMGLIEAWKKVMPEELEEMVSWYNSVKINEIYWELGHNVFNDKCIISSGYLYAFHRYFYRPFTNGQDFLYQYRGEAPRCLFFNISGIRDLTHWQGIFGYKKGSPTDPSGHNFQINIYQNYSNYDDIPQREPWLIDYYR